MKNNKGFTLVEIIVVLVILAILAAATIPSMLGFVNDAKKKADSAEIRAVYLAAQSYAIEELAKGTNPSAIATAINGDPTDNEHALYTKLNGDATGTISGTQVSSNGVVLFGYTKDSKYTVFRNGVGIDYDGATPAASYNSP